MVRTILTVAFVVVLAASLEAQAPPASERYALLVAVREYPKAKLGNLRYVENDIDLLAAALKAAGYKEANLVRLSQAVGGQAGKARYSPTGENIRRELKVLLGSLGKGDSVLVAFAGHGVQFQGRKESYFCPSDGDLEQLDSLLAISDVYAQLKDSSARVKVLLVDACRNDPALAASRGPRGVELEPVGKPQEVEPPQGIAALFSCSAGQKAWEDTELRHGVFFSFVIAGLKGAADFNKDDQVTYDELSAYSINEVKRHARVKLGELQVPQQKGEFEGQISLARVPRPVPPLAVVPFDAAAAKKHQQEWAAYARVEPVTTNSNKMKLVLIPAGEFMMGSPAEEELRHEDEQQHRVRITKPFYLGQSEVTIGQFRAFVTDEKYRTASELGGGGNGFNVDTQRFEGPNTTYNWSNSGWNLSDDRPVMNVNKSDAMAFCAWLSRKEARSYWLPTEAEWEFACRAGSTTAYFHGNDAEGLAQMGNIFDGTAKGSNPGSSVASIAARDGYVFTSPVAQFNANAFGLFDMHGNVWEFCSDWYGENYYSSLADRVADDPQGPADGGVAGRIAIRGGAFIDGPRGLRSADRFGVVLGYRGCQTGFRVARSP